MSGAPLSRICAPLAVGPNAPLPANVSVEGVFSNSAAPLSVKIDIEPLGLMEVATPIWLAISVTSESRLS